MNCPVVPQQQSPGNNVSPDPKRRPTCWRKLIMHRWTCPEKTQQVQTQMLVTTRDQCDFVLLLLGWQFLCKHVDHSKKFCWNPPCSAFPQSKQITANDPEGEPVVCSWKHPDFGRLNYCKSKQCFHCDMLSVYLLASKERRPCGSVRYADLSRCRHSGRVPGNICGPMTQTLCLYSFKC